MRLELVVYVLGLILIVYSSAMIPALGIGLWFGTGGVGALSVSVLLTAAVGIAMLLARDKSTDTDITPREGFLIVAGGWMLCSLFGALPFFIANTFVSGDASTIGTLFASLSDSVFESASGLTTTGASVMTFGGELPGSFEQPHAIMFWRSTNHWLGGMGIIVLSLAILPLIGAGGMQLFKAEVPGPVKDRLKPRIADTAFTLSKVYVLITVVETVALKLCGMGWYNALCHSFGTVATGGFSTHSQSVGGYDSLAINLVIIFFMIIAGASFALHYRFLKGEFSVYHKSGELRVYLLLIVVATGLITFMLIGSGKSIGFGDSVEHSLFQVVSIITTTGYATVDFEEWPKAACMLLFFLMFVGGCAGSTGGGMKVIRIILLVKIAFREMKRLIYPASVVVVKQDGEPIPEKVLSAISGFFILVGAMFVVSSIIISLSGYDFETSITATVACLFNIGPGLGLVGPYDNFAHFPSLIKWWLSLCMIVGRLELYSVLILAAPDFWKR